MVAPSLHSNAAQGFVLTPFSQAIAALTAGTQPSHCTIFFMRLNMRRLGIWAFAGHFAPIITLLSVFVATIACDLYDAIDDFVLFGEDLVVLIGLCLIYFKICLSRCRSVEIEAIIDRFDELHQEHAAAASGAAVGRSQRWCFIGEMLSFAVFYFIAILLLIAIGAQPLLTTLRLPLRAKFPFGWHDHARHPLLFGVLYAFQCACILYCLTVVLVMDNLTCHMGNQVALNLRVLCARIRALEAAVRAAERPPSGAEMWRRVYDLVHFHQRIIGLTDDVNACFYWNYVGQMGASTFIICLTAFEALLAKDQPMVAFKFLTYMFAGLMQLFYFCWMGNRVYFDSMEVATAAYETHEWYTQSPQLQLNVKFLMQRAQKPLVLRAQPFLPFSFATFTSILSSSYTYFTMLRTMNN